ncbi:hypothetical protein M316_0068 [Nitrincola phage 1M3-16]|uniref:hypothetical protein n=1 Tax=Nitrincola phage 1M3-16 TaxID=1472912 RepID=UPI000444E8C4|nr:hypothetical protein GJ22_gp084 [Nitrincola phage 1M3-16]AHX01133.1 hypothetical protein M316_0068 [Nitrincola phage 1M3-16]
MKQKHTIDITQAPEWAEALGVIFCENMEHYLWVGGVSYAYVEEPHVKYAMCGATTFNYDDIDLIERF